MITHAMIKTRREFGFLVSNPDGPVLQDTPGEKTVYIGNSGKRTYCHGVYAVHNRVTSTVRTATRAEIEQYLTDHGYLSILPLLPHVGRPAVGGKQLPQIRVSEDVYADLKAIAAEFGVSVADIRRRAYEDICRRGIV